MARYTLVIGNKNYSSWSLRAWLAMKQAGIEFDEVRVPLFEDGYKARIENYSPAGKVPVLVAGKLAIWDSLAICEFLAERHPEQRLWPADLAARAQARAICAEMHAGFLALRNAMPMNIRSSHPGKGMTPEVKRDIDRITAMWEQCRKTCGSGGELLFGQFTAADAFYAPVASRFQTYAVTLPPVAHAYADAVLRLSAMQEWMAAARQETEFVAEDEPYAKAIGES
jgi:glutathione S-transferase